MHAVSVAPSTAQIAPERHLVVQPDPREAAAAVRDAAAVAAAEFNRWLIFLTVPLVLSALFFMALLSTGRLWLIGGTLVTGPGLLIMAFIYLAISSDSNGDAP
jgi:hypothetical protein